MAVISRSCEKICASQIWIIFFCLKQMLRCGREKNIVGCVINQLSACQTVCAVLLCLAVIKSGIIDRYFIRDDLVIGKIGISFKKNFAFFCVQHVKLYQIFTFFPTKNYPFLAKL